MGENELFFLIKVRLSYVLKLVKPAKYFIVHKLSIDDFIIRTENVAFVLFVVTKPWEEERTILQE